VGGGGEGAGERGHHEPNLGPPAAAAQKKTLVARERDATARAAFRAEAAGWDAHDLVVLDETTTPTTLRARTPRGERAVGTVPRGRWEQVTLICALTPDGMAAPVLLPGALDRDAVDTWVAEQLVPALRPGQTVLLDTLSVHRSATARALMAAAGCALRHLPTSSPDMNPIEQAFAKIKAALRRAEARAFDGVVAAARPALAAVTAGRCPWLLRGRGLPPRR